MEADELRPDLLGHRLPGRDDPLPRAHPIAHRVHARAKLLPPGAGHRQIGNDRGMVEGAHHPPERALPRRVLDHDPRHLGLLHEIGEGEDRVARHDEVGIVPPERHLAAGLAADDASVGHAFGQRLTQEMGDDLAASRGAGWNRQGTRSPPAPDAPASPRPPAMSSGPCLLARSRSAKKSRAAARAES